MPIPLMAEIRQRIIAEFPVGSEWYACNSDDIAVVVAHFEPRGIICRMKGASRPDEASYEQFDYGELLHGVLCPLDGNGGKFSAYRDLTESESCQLKEIYEALPKGRVWK